MPRPSTLALCLGAVCLGLTGTACGGAGGSTSPTAPPTAPPEPSATAAVTPLPSPSATSAPPVQQVAVVTTGLGSYLETTVPLAIIRNLDTSEAATGVVVHLRVTNAGGAQVAAADPDLGAIAAGATVIVPARVAGSLRGDRVTATVDVAAWAAAPAPPARTLAAVAAAPVCASCAGGGSGSVAVTVTGDTAGISLFVGAACRDAGGAIVGGGSAVHAGGPTGTPIAVVVPVILSAPATRCDDVSAALGGF